MSGGTACPVRAHRPAWSVAVREANYSAFNGGRRTPSAWSSIWCPLCPARWRTRAGYVRDLPDTPWPAP